MSKEKSIKIDCRVYNFYASEARDTLGVMIHPELKEVIEQMADHEKKSVSWIVETALADYFGYKIPLKKTKFPPRPEFKMVRGRKRG